MYTAYRWVNGEIVNAEKLNRMEKGIEDASKGSNYATLVECDQLFIGFLEDEEEE